MKTYEKQLLRKMHLEEVSSNNEPLKNIKEGLGTVRFLKGNPLTKTQITLNVAINFFRNQQRITSAALPVNLRTKFPVFLLGLTDFYSGYPKSLISLPVANPWESNLNYSYREGPELIDQTIWGTPFYWNFASPNFVFNGLAGISDFADGNPLNNIVKNNFSWIPGHLYKISITGQNAVPGTAPNEIALFDGVNFGIFTPPYNIMPLEPKDWQTLEYYYIPTTTNLQLLSNVVAAGDQLIIRGMSIKEIFGDIQYPSDNSMGIYGYNKSFVLSQGVEKGDLVQTYNFISRNEVNVMAQPTINLYTAEVIIHCENVAYGTFLNSFVSDLITINTIRYIVPVANILQFVNPIKFSYQTLFGKTFTDNIDPRNYITNKDFQPQIADIPINLPIDKAAMVGTDIDFNCAGFSMILFVEKVEALTHK